MSVFKYREAILRDGEHVDISDNVHPAHIALSRHRVVWLEPIYPDLTGTPLSSRLPQCVSVDIDLGKRGSTREAIAVTDGDFSWQEGSE